MNRLKTQKRIRTDSSMITCFGSPNNTFCNSYHSTCSVTCRLQSILNMFITSFVYKSLLSDFKLFLLSIVRMFSLSVLKFMYFLNQTLLQALVKLFNRLIWLRIYVLCWQLIYFLNSKRYNALLSKEYTRYVHRRILPANQLISPAWMKHHYFLVLEK